MTMKTTSYSYERYISQNLQDPKCVHILSNKGYWILIKLITEF
jgi:hypothetical protein